MSTRSSPVPGRDLPVTTERLDSFSYGGGWQSTAALVLAARGDLDCTTFLFANVGHDSENPETLEYLYRYAVPFAAAHDIDLVELHRVRRGGDIETLYQRLTRPGSRSIPIPVRMSNGAPGTRSCTADFKIKVVGKYVRNVMGASAENPATVGLGISVDEIHRANNRRSEPYERIVYPLLDLGIRRADCPGIIRSAGLPVPPPSSCWFCPHHRMSAWADMRRTRHWLFEASCELEHTINARRRALGRDQVWLSNGLGPLAQVVPTDKVLPLDDSDEGCDGGWCFT